MYDKKRVRVAMIEKPISMPDYRILTLDNELVGAYKREPLTIVGCGDKTIRELLIKLQERYNIEGREITLNPDDARIYHHLASQGQTVENIPDKGEELVLVPILNMSAGGTSIDVTDTVNTRWVDLANNIASNFGLRFCGLDIGCNDISSATSEYSVLEVNSKPGIKHYASSGNAQRLICDNLYKKIFNTMNLDIE